MGSRIASPDQATFEGKINGVGRLSKVMPRRAMRSSHFSGAFDLPIEFG